MVHKTSRASSGGCHERFSWDMYRSGINNNFIWILSSLYLYIYSPGIREQEIKQGCFSESYMQRIVNFPSFFSALTSSRGRCWRKCCLPCRRKQRSTEEHKHGKLKRKGNWNTCSGSEPGVLPNENVFLLSCGFSLHENRFLNNHAKMCVHIFLQFSTPATERTKN